MVFLLWVVGLDIREIMGAIVWVILLAIVRANLVFALAPNHRLTPK